MNPVNHKIKLSIVTICKNEAASIPQTLKSVLSQSFSGYEHIIIDGGSTDETMDIVRSYQNKILKIISEPDRGIWHAMNKGISLAEGEYLYFLNAGDTLFDQEVLKDIFNEVKHEEELIYGNIVDSYSERQVLKKFSDTLSVKYLMSNMICHQAMFTRKTLFKRYGYFDESFKLLADYDFLWRCIVKHKATYRHVDRTIAYYDMNGLTADPRNREILIREWAAVQRKNMSAHQYLYFCLFRPALIAIRDFFLQRGKNDRK